MEDLMQSAGHQAMCQTCHVVTVSNSAVSLGRRTQLGTCWSSFSEVVVDSHQQEVTSTYKDLSNGGMVQQA